MVDIKTKEEIAAMKEGGKILADVLSSVLDHIKPGVTELELDELAEKLIKKQGAEPGFRKVKGYRHSICVSTNNVVVHGIPTRYAFKEEDVVGVDCGVFYKGFHTDMAETIRVQKMEDRRWKTEDEIDRFLKIGKKALEGAIKQAKPGNRIGHIAKSIQAIVESSGYSVVRSLIGHGVGRNLHEEPEVPGFLVDTINKTPRLLEGMTIAIEVIYNMGTHEVQYGNSDGWTISTADSSLSGLFERTVAITKDGPFILTQ